MSLTLLAVLSLCLWKGEEHYLELPENISLPENTAPFEVKQGVLREVSGAFDRVEWNATDGAHRVALITVPRSVKAGKYTLGDLKVTVIDRVLPEKRTFRLDLWQHPWAVARVVGVEPFSKAHYQAMEPLWKMLAKAGQKYITTTIVSLPWNHQCYDGYDSMIKEGDYSEFDRYVEFCRKCGLGPYIACYTMVPWGKPVDPESPEFENRWKPFLKSFTDHLRKKGWLEYTYISLDERPPAVMKKVVEFIRKYGRGLKISAAGNHHPSEFKGIEIDDFSLGISYVTEDFIQNELPRRHASGETTTTYVCCDPPKPNTFLTSAPEEAYFLAVFQKVIGSDGLLRWAYNSWPKDPKKDGAYGNWPSGDTYLVYPDCEPSVRFLELNNGIQAFEKWFILEKDARFKPALKELAARYELKKARSAGRDWFRELKTATDEVLNRHD